MASILFWLGERLRIALAVALLLPVGVVAAPGFLVCSDWLAERIDDENLVVLEVRYHPHRYFTVGHIRDGFRMSLAWMQLKHLGYEDIRLYNGGWSHWGNTLTLPVVEGAAPYDEAFAL
jgi:3-mercaptopyruvate sulfurtransferase SseA